jgi:hypothetical protein
MPQVLSWPEAVRAANPVTTALFGLFSGFAILEDARQAASAGAVGAPPQHAVQRAVIDPTPLREAIHHTLPSQEFKTGGFYSVYQPGTGIARVLSFLEGVLRCMLGRCLPSTCGFRKRKSVLPRPGAVSCCRGDERRWGAVSEVV